MKESNSTAENGVAAAADAVVPALTVSEITGRIKRLFAADEFRAVRILGEISNFKHHLGRHMYFRLKDAGAQIACAFYHPANTRTPFTPRDGMEVVASGYIGVYEQRGEYQLYVRALEESGMGALFRELEELKRKLREEGLTSPEHKRPLPEFPRRIGIVASAESAGLQDMLQALRRRWPMAVVVLAPVAVEGAASAPSIAAGLELMAAHGRADVVITGRGGGSIESLWGFNTERVARAIASMPMPVIAAVGHETDTTIADLVADRRAITPTEAIELATPDGGEIEDRLGDLAARMVRRLEFLTTRRRERLALVARALRAPDRLWESRMERMARLGDRMASSIERRGDRRRQDLRTLKDRAAARSPERRLDLMASRLEASGVRVTSLVRERQDIATSRVAVLAGRLSALNPTAVLARGYAVVLRGGRAVTRARDLAEGDLVRLRLAEGEAAAVVK